jgi:hypothetical protein
VLQRTPKDLEPSGAVGWILIALIVAIGLAVWCIGWGPL